MMFGLGASTTTGATAAITTSASTLTTPALSPSTAFEFGLMAWGNPSTAVTGIEQVFRNASTVFGTSVGSALAAGLLLPPVALIGALMFAMSQSGGRH